MSGPESAAPPDARTRGPVAAAVALVDRFIPRGAISLALLTMAAYVAGLLAKRALARTFGNSIELDAYNAAFTFPELVLDVLVAAGLTAPFIPVFTRLRRDGAAAANDFGRTVLTAAVLVMSTASALLFIFAPETAGFIVPGFDAAEQDLYVELYRVMTITPVLFAASITLGELLVANQRFIFYALAPILYNVGIVIGTVTLSDRIGIFGAAVGAVLGACLHLGIRVVGIFRTDFRYRPNLRVRTAAFREFFRLMIPKMIAAPIEPAIFLEFTRLATTIVAGGVSAMNFARDFQSVPVSVIGISFSLAVFPVISAAWAAGDRSAYVSTVRRNVLTIAALASVAAVGLVVVGPLGIRLLLGGGAFDEEDVATTAAILTVFALSVPFEAVSHPLARAIYASHNTVLPVLASLAGLVVTVVAARALAPDLALAALPAGFSIGSATKVGLLVVGLGLRLRAGPPPPPPSPAAGTATQPAG